MTFTTFGLMAALGMLLLLLAAGLWCRREKLSYGVWIRLCVLAIPLAFVGSRLLFSLFAFFNGDMPSLLNTLTFWDGGASVTGAFIGVVIAAALTEKLCRVPGGTLLDGVALGMPLALICERLAEPLHELGIGRPVDTEFLYFLGSATDDRHPVFIYEAVVALLILLALLWMVRRPVKHRGNVLLTFMVLYGCPQMLLESLRDDAHMVIYFIRINQIAALLMAVVAFVIWLVRWIRKGAKLPFVLLACAAVVAGIALGVVQEFAVDSNMNLLLEYAIMALSTAVIAVTALLVRGKAE